MKSPIPGPRRLVALTGRSTVAYNLKKMERKQRLFIYDRREMGVLILLGVMVAFFAFTFGVHLGKKVVIKAPVTAGHEAQPAETLPDQVPHRQELQDHSKGAQQAVDESLNQALHDEVARTGVKLDSPRQVKLPEKTKVGGGAAKTVSAIEPEAPVAAPEKLDSVAAFSRALPQGRFTLQIGSYNTLQDAKDQVDSMETLGLKPSLRVATIPGKGRWYRVLLGGFNTRDDAEQAGDRYRSQHVIETFVISKITE